MMSFIFGTDSFRRRSLSGGLVRTNSALARVKQNFASPYWDTIWSYGLAKQDTLLANGY